MKKALILIFTFILMLFAMSSANTPKQAFDDFVTAIKTSDGEKSWELLSIATQDSFNQLYAMLAGMMEVADDEIVEMSGVTSGKTLWIKAITESSSSGMDMSAGFDNVTVTREEIAGNKATLTVKSGTKVDKIDLTKENGTWKLDMSKALAPLSGTDSSCPVP